MARLLGRLSCQGTAVVSARSIGRCTQGPSCAESTGGRGGDSSAGRAHFAMPEHRVQAPGTTRERYARPGGGPGRSGVAEPSPLSASNGDPDVEATPGICSCAPLEHSPFISGEWA